MSEPTAARRILCAEDDLALGPVLKRYLEINGHVVDWVHDGLEALRRLLSQHYDVLVTDNQMPQIDGLELVTKLRDSGFAGTIVVHSAHLSREDERAYRALAVDEIISKPADLQLLLRAVGAPRPANDGGEPG